VVIGAHYDHVGYGLWGSNGGEKAAGQIHNGADDNGSGTTGLMELARRFGALKNREGRRIVFIAFSGEEHGLDGSRFYCKEPLFPLDKTTTMLNLDMIGRTKPVNIDWLGLFGQKGFQEWLQPYIESSGLTVKQTKSGFGPSDHASFTGVKVPTLFFFTQLHKEYHTPLDVVDTINFDGAVQVTDLAFRIAFDAARRPEAFVFSTGEPKADSPAAEKPAEKKDEPAKDEAKKDEPARENRPGNVGGLSVGVRFGIAPGDYAGEEPGVLVGEVFPDLPAAKAGLKEGDLMTKWNDTELKDVAGWMPLLSKAKPGDVVKITYRREVDGEMKEFTTDCTLVARAPRPQQ